MQDFCFFDAARTVMLQSGSGLTNTLVFVILKKEHTPFFDKERTL